MRCFAVVIGGLTGSFLTIVASVPSVLFTPRHQQLAGAAVFSPIGCGFIVGPVAAGLVVGSTGSYVGAKLLAAGCLGMSAVMGGLVGRQPPK